MSQPFGPDDRKPNLPLRLRVDNVRELREANGYKGAPTTPITLKTTESTTRSTTNDLSEAVARHRGILCLNGLLVEDRKAELGYSEVMKVEKLLPENPESR
ncbi:MAG: hypothetical protein Q9191_000159 [Dirinaria sp. TL-2023a]